MSEHAEILADSLSPEGVRLTTFIVRLWRPLTAQFNTHRALCLAGDTEIWMRQPNGTARRETIASLYDKWHHGAAPRPNKKGRNWPLHLLDDDSVYTTIETMNLLGMANQMNLNFYCRTGRIANAAKREDGQWTALGKHIRAALTPGVNRQPMQERLRSVAVDQIDETSLDLNLTSIVDIISGGKKEVFEVKVDNHTIKASADHRFFTPEGWVKVRDFVPGQKVACVFYGKPESEHHGDRFKQVNGRWVGQWMREIKHLLPKDCPCGAPAVDGHHMVPVHQDTSLAFELSNIAHLCQECHDKEHATQGWQKGAPRYVDYGEVRSVTPAGVEETYDLTVAGRFPNFIANGFIVHNSRNSASSRAIPVTKMVNRKPMFPMIWPAEQPGMQPGDELPDSPRQDAEDLYWNVYDTVTTLIDYYIEDHPDPSTRLHKSYINRLLEPFQTQEILVTATDWDNFFNLRGTRLNQDTQHEFAVVADTMQQLLETATPTPVAYGEWHRPLLRDDDTDIPEDDLNKVSVGRCARISYLTHQGIRDPQKDIELHDRLAADGHASPFEHVATPAHPCDDVVLGNFDGWHQYRHTEGIDLAYRHRHLNTLVELSEQAGLYEATAEPKETR